MERPIVFFDNETTGADAIKDRIVQFAAIKCKRSLTTIDEERNWLINPTIPISPAASAVHGITDADITNAPKFAEIACDLATFLDGCDYAGYNIKDFDVPMLSEEFYRCGIKWPAKGARFLDAFSIYRSKERRDLSAAYRFYCGAELRNAHDAAVDIRATRDVLVGQMSIYDDLATIDQVAAFCNDPKALDLAGKIVLDEKGIAVYSFGKDKGKSVEHNPGFGRWMLGQSFASDTKEVVKSLIS